MIQLRRSGERGYFDHGWLKSFHTFSFSEYYDPKFMGFSVLRVINQDWVAPGEGFPSHPHKDMEIVTYMLEGTLEHKDSTGGRGQIKKGEIQRMTAGSGIAHSEFNASPTEPAELIQIWIQPAKKGLPPTYEQKAVSDQEKRGKFVPIISPAGGKGVMQINQDASIWAALLDDSDRAVLDLAPGRKAWVHVAKGSVKLNGKPLNEGDGAAVVDEGKLDFTEGKKADILVFDVA
jgi:quercetin 2,3-dioxygenase